MRALTLKLGDDSPARAIGAMLAHDLRRPGSKSIVFRKGHRFGPEDVSRLAELGDSVIHLLELEPGDIHEEEAGLRLTQAVSGEGVKLKGYIGAQYHLVAAQRGLLQVDAELLSRVNALDGVSVFTVYDGQPVEEGELLAGVKVIPLAISEQVILEAEELCRAAPPLRVLGFQSMTVGVLILEKIDQGARAKFKTALEQKLGWFGARLGSMQEVENDPAAFIRAFQQLRDEGVELIMAAGASSLDPLEPLFISLREIGARIEKHGVPIHPGSLFWIAYLPTQRQQVPVFGLSSCEMFSHKTVLDLVLPRLFTGQRVERRDLVALGHGGLLTRDMAFRFPPYGERGKER